MAIDLLNNCHFSGDKIRTLWVGSRLTNGQPISYPIEYTTVTGSTDSIIKIQAWDKINNIVTIGGQQIQLNEITNTGDNISFDEELVIDQNGKRYTKTISFSVPKVNIFTTNQIREFVMTVSGLYALAPTLALLEDENDQTLIVGYDKPLSLSANEILVSEDDNGYSLTYQSSSFSRARNYSL